MKGVGFLCIILGFLVLTGCDSQVDDEPIYFVGDSLVARWDLQSYFSTNITYNFGKGDEGVEYIEGKRGEFVGKTVVILIGCNDHRKMSEGNMPSYVNRYFEAVNNLQAKRIYLLQLLPRFFANDPPGVNERICQFNNCVEERVSKYERITYIKTYSRFMDDGKQISGYFLDGVHLTETGYTELADIVFPYINP